MKKIIAIRGKANVGKTTTIREFKSLLEEKKIQIKNLNYHLKVEVLFTFDYCGKHIGVTSRGDGRKYLEEDFKTLGKCDIYICACRTKGSTIAFLNDFAKKEDIVFFDIKSLMCTEKQKEMAKGIFETIKAIII